MPVERETMVKGPIERKKFTTVGSTMIVAIAAALGLVLLTFWTIGGMDDGGGGQVNGDLPEVSVTP